jgi:hypothetical protein
MSARIRSEWSSVAKVVYVRMSTIFDNQPLKSEAAGEADRADGARCRVTPAQMNQFEDDEDASFVAHIKQASIPLYAPFSMRISLPEPLSSAGGKHVWLSKGK